MTRAIRVIPFSVVALTGNAPKITGDVGKSKTLDTFLQILLPG